MPVRGTVRKPAERSTTQRERGAGLCFAKELREEGWLEGSLGRILTKRLPDGVCRRCENELEEMATSSKDLT